MLCKRFFSTAIAALLLVSNVQAVTVTWVGGANGDWNDPDVWDAGSGPVNAQTAFGRTNGSEGAHDIVIPAGSDVEYNLTNRGDFRVTQAGSLTIKAGSTWRQDTDDNYGGNSWTRLNPKVLDIDGGTFSRVGTSVGEQHPLPGFDGTDPLGNRPSGGVFTIGGLTGSGANQVTNVNIHNGGKLLNEGQFILGYWGNGADKVNQQVTININNGSMDLTGGLVNADGPGTFGGTDATEWTGDLLFVDHLAEDNPAGPKLSINFTGPGTIKTDYGITNPSKSDGANWFDWDVKLTWEQVWAKGLLQANGKSGVDGLNFSDYFSTTGTFDGTDYTLTSKIPGANLYDLNSDGAVDAADAGVMFGDWGGPGSTSPADFNKDTYVDASDAGEMFAAWTGDPAAPGANAATAEYNFETGELKVSSAGAVNLFVQSAGSHITPLNPAPSVPVGLLTNNASRVGITNLGPINVENFSFGNIGKGLAQSDLKLVYTPALGQKGIEVGAGTAAFTYIPEPASFGMIGLGLAGLLAARRRS